jgi:hypothetical protein
MKVIKNFLQIAGNDIVVTPKPSCRLQEGIAIRKL